MRENGRALRRLTGAARGPSYTKSRLAGPSCLPGCADGCGSASEPGRTLPAASLRTGEAAVSPGVPSRAPVSLPSAVSPADEALLCCLLLCATVDAAVAAVLSRL